MSKILEQMAHGAELHTVAENFNLSQADIVDFSSNINPFGFTEELWQTAAEALLKSPAYPEDRAQSLRRKLAEKFSLDSELIIVANGAADLIYRIAGFLSLEARRNKQEAALNVLLAPSFSEYALALKAYELELYYHYLHAENRFCLEEGFLEFIEQSEAEILSIWLCQPNNPTGQLIPSPLLGKIRQICRRKGIYLILDECFLNFLEPERAAAYSLRAGQSANEVILKSFTKLFAIPGLRIGYLETASPELAQKLNSLIPAWQVSRPALAAAEEALDISEARLSEWREKLEAERKRLQGVLAELGAEQISGEANYLFFRYEDSDLQEKLLANTPPILIRSCANYPGLDEHYFRIAVKDSKANDTLAKALRKVRGVGR